MKRIISNISNRRLTHALQTERLILRPYRKSDLKDLHRICSNPNIGITGGWKPHESIEESEQILKYYFMEQPFKWAIKLASTGEMIGSIGLSPDEKRPSTNINSVGYWLAEEHWGNGYATEALKAVLFYAFRSLHLEIITADCYPHNPASRRVLEKSGFTYEGTLHDAAKIFTGEIFDLQCFYIYHPLLNLKKSTNSEQKRE